MSHSGHNVDHVALRQALHGVAVTNVSVFDSESGALDLAAIRTNVRYILDGGIRVLVPCGNTGEFHSLARDEWNAIVEAVLEVARGSAAKTTMVLPAVGGALPDACAMARHAQQLGADGVLLMPLHHTYRSPEGAYRYCTEVLNAVDIGVAVYVRDETLTDAVLLRLAQHPNLVAAKYALPDVRRFANLRAQEGAEKVVWTCGIAELWAPMFFLAGAVGFTSGLANFAPRLARALFTALSAGDWGRAMQLRDQIVPFEMLRTWHDQATNVPAVKAAMEVAGLPGGAVRPPLTPLAAGDQTALEGAAAPLLALEREYMAAER